MKHISHTELIHNHMAIPLRHHLCQIENPPITEATLPEKASIIGRTGLMLLSCGTGAWRVRSSMNTWPELWESPVPPTSDWSPSNILVSIKQKHFFSLSV